MKKKYPLLLLCLLGCIPLNGSAQNAMFEWATQTGGDLDDYGFALTVVGNGDVLITGFFEDTVDFDPGPGLETLISSGESDMFIQKLDANGNLLWVRHISGTEEVLGLTITTDANGNIYASGSFRGTVDFEPGPGVTNMTSNGSEDIFLMKLDPVGNLIWVKTIGGNSLDSGRSVKIDLNGDVLLGGHFRTTVDFDPNAGTANLTSSSASQDGFVLKLDENGNFIWAHRVGGINTDVLSEVEIDPNNDVYLTGGFQWIVDFDPGPNVLNITSNGSWDFYLQKLTSNGDFVWVKHFGGTGQETALALEIDANGNIFTTGRFNFTVDFDPGPGVTNLTSNGLHDIFFHKLDPNGDLLWAKSIGGTGWDFGYGMTLDNAGNMYTIGGFVDTVDFDPGPGTFNLITDVFQDIFILKQDNNGDFLWVKQIGGTLNDRGQAVATYGTDDVYLTGYFNDSVDFNPGAEEYNLNVNGQYDAYVLKLTACQTSFGTDQVTACDSFIWLDGNTYTASNNSATFLSTNAMGCDSIITLDLTILNSSAATDVHSTCAPFTWINGNTYMASTDTVTWTLTNSVGCDSVVTLDLTINNNSGTDQVTACDSYMWIDGNTYTSSNTTATYTLTNTAGCDSVVTLNLTLNNSSSGTDVITACDSYTWIDGNTYTSSNNTATFTLTNAAGCDSLVTLDLTINTVDVTVTSTDPTLSANAIGAQYQWLDCDDNFSIIQGATAQSFAPVANGTYAVEVSENGCLDTSSCFSIVTVSLFENQFGTDLTLFPNPTNGEFFIDLGQNYDRVTIQITDLKGRLLQSQRFVDTELVEMELNTAPGVYFVEIVTGKTQTVLRLTME